MCFLIRRDLFQKGCFLSVSNTLKKDEPFPFFSLCEKQPSERIINPQPFNFIYLECFQIYSLRCQFRNTIGNVLVNDYALPPNKQYMSDIGMVIRFRCDRENNYFKSTIGSSRCSRSGAANQGPAGHFWPARTFKMIHEEFLTDTC